MDLPDKMPDTKPDSTLDEKRQFPRMPAECPILYRHEHADTWYLGKLIDFSATGLSIISDQIVAANSVFEFQIKPGDNKAIPRFEGKGIVKRCISKTHRQYHLSCQLTKIQTPDK